MKKEKLDVGKLYKDIGEHLKLDLVSSEAGFSREITDSELHRPGLVLAGFIDLFTFHRVQILGNTEIRYLDSLASDEKRNALERMLQFELPCVIVTDSNAVPEELVKIATRRYISVFSTSYDTTRLYHLLSDYLTHIFSPQTTVHGTLADVYGIGLLFTGRSGIGKSEIALDLVERGHRLVADDLVIITKKSEEILMGEGRDISEHMIEIRGVGVVDVRDIFGIRGVRVHKRIEVEVQLVEFDPRANYDRTGLDEQTTTVLGVNLPKVVLPVNPGKNITVIAETIALNRKLKIMGHNTAIEFNTRLMAKMKKQERAHLQMLKMRDFLNKDFE